VVGTAYRSAVDIGGLLVLEQKLQCLEQIL